MVPPANYTEVRCFLGMTGFFRRFIKNYARITKPLNDILEGEGSKMKSEAITLPSEAMEAFERLKMCCMTAPILAFADFEKEIPAGNWCVRWGTGRHAVPEATWWQVAPHRLWKPWAERGGGPNTTLRSWSSWLSSGPLRNSSGEYLQYRLFTVFTDNNPLTYILTTPNLDALGHRWVAALASYNMTIKYLKGSDNKVADALSWIKTRLNPETVTELLNHAKGGAPGAKTEDIRIIEEDESGSGGHPPCYSAGSSR